METPITKEEIELLKEELNKTYSQRKRLGSIDFYMNTNLMDTKKYKTAYQRQEILRNWQNGIRGLMASFHKFHYVIKDVELIEKKHPYKPITDRPIKKRTLNPHPLKPKRKYTKPEPIRRKIEEPNQKIIRPKGEYSNQRLYDYI